MKIVIVGADGQLGTDLCKVIPKEEQIPLTVKEFDVTQPEQVVSQLSRLRPDVVINTAAYHQVDRCEEELDKAFSVNTYALKNLAAACQAIDACLVHFSTDYVFDGEKGTPYLESDCPNPQSIYAISKLAGEQIIKYLLVKYYIIRSSGLYGTAGCLGKGGNNFVETMISRSSQGTLRVVTDEFVSPTYTLDLARKIYQLLPRQAYGLYHIVNQGSCSWYQFAVEIFRQLKKTITIEGVTAAVYNSQAKRPKYSVLKNANLAALGWDDLRPWQEALAAYLKEKGYL